MQHRRPVCKSVRTTATWEGNCLCTLTEDSACGWLGNSPGATLLLWVALTLQVQTQNILSLGNKHRDSCPGADAEAVPAQLVWCMEAEAHDWQPRWGQSVRCVTS